MQYLVVDDDTVFREVLQRALKRRGLKVIIAEDISSALQLANSHKFTHAIVDLKLAQESGLTLIQELKIINPHLNIVMLTGYSSISTAVEAIKLGATNYLCKPVDADEILAAFSINTSDTHAQISRTPISVDRLEWEHIQKILQENQGNISATARSLGMHRRTLQRKLQKHPVRR